MNVVLIHPYITVRNTDIYLSEPLGLVCLASYIEQVLGEDVKVTILDLYARGGDKPQPKGDFYVLGMADQEYIQTEIRKLHPELIGIHCNFTAYFKDSLEIALLAKQALPNIPIVMGGAHATIEAEAILQNNPCIDFVVRGEGEMTLEELVRALSEGDSPKNIQGLSYRASANEIISNPERELIEDLDILPIPNRKFIDMERYKAFNKECTWYVR